MELEYVFMATVNPQTQKKIFQYRGGSRTLWCEPTSIWGYDNGERNFGDPFWIYYCGKWEDPFGSILQLWFISHAPAGHYVVWVYDCCLCWLVGLLRPLHRISKIPKPKCVAGHSEQLWFLDTHSPSQWDYIRFGFISTSSYLHLTFHLFISLFIYLSHFLGGLSLHLNHLIAERMSAPYWQFGTLPIGIVLSNLDSRQLKTSLMTSYCHFWNLSTFGDSRAVWVFRPKLGVFRKSKFSRWRSDGALMWLGGFR